MADNTILNPGTGGDNIATDEVSTLNGAASSGVKVQRVKVMYGSENDARDVDTSFPLPSRVMGQTLDTAGFSAVGSSVIDDFFVQTPFTGTGVSYNQGSGSINIVAGTTANAEFLARSQRAFRGSMRMRHTIISSARIANNNFAVLLADLIGEGLAVTVNSATSITVTIPGHTFTSQNVGQFVLVGAVSGVAGVPGRYAIASVVAGTSINLTVAGWPASGSGTATLFGRNYIRNLFNGTTATNFSVDAQRNGWASGDTTAGITTTASPGVMVQVEVTGREVFWSESLRASSLTPNVTTRASRYENIPEGTVNLYVFLWSYNGTTNPASSTTWTLGSLAIENFQNAPFYIQGIRSQGSVNALPVSFPTAQTVSVTAIANALPSGTSMVGHVGLTTPVLVQDVSATAITSSANLLAVFNPWGAANEFSITVTAVSGTSPTYDVVVQESVDNGSNWNDVYHFPRITAAGSYRSPVIPNKSSNQAGFYRYVQTVGGTTPSFTRTVRHNASSWTGAAMIRRIFDRSLNSTQALNSITTTAAGTPLQVHECTNLQLAISAGAITTTAPALQLQGSNDNGVSWISIGTPLTAVANSTVQTTLVDVNYEMVRAIVTTAGSGATLNYVEIKGF